MSSLKLSYNDKQVVTEQLNIKYGRKYPIYSKNLTITRNGPIIFWSYSNSISKIQRVINWPIKIVYFGNFVHPIKGFHDSKLFVPKVSLIIAQECSYHSFLVLVLSCMQSLEIVSPICIPVPAVWSSSTGVDSDRPANVCILKTASTWEYFDGLKVACDKKC